MRHIYGALDSGESSALAGVRASTAEILKNIESPSTTTTASSWRDSLSAGDEGGRNNLPLTMETAHHGSQSDRQGVGRYERISRSLLSVWPCERDLRLITDAAGSAAAIPHQRMLSPYPELFRVKKPLTINVDVMPPPTAHPALIARKLLHLAVLLGHLHPVLHKQLSELSKPHRDIMRHMADAAVGLVTSRDELVGSVEGLECIILEGIHQGNIGNLRRSWLAFRRAMVIAQMMGLHRGGKSRGIKFLDPKTEAYPEYMWFRICYADRILSVMLGLPYGSPDSSFASQARMEEDLPIGRLERLHCLIGGQIIDLNNHGDPIRKFDETREIDKKLRDAAAVLGSRWWLIPNIAELHDPFDIAHGALKMSSQIFHYILVTVTHLPYMMRASSDPRFAYSRLTCVSASREVLNRFVVFRGYNQVSYVCRTIDFFSFIASMTLLIAHLEAHRASSEDNLLAHQRLGDRGMVERVLESMEEMARLNNDVLSQHSAMILRKLLAVEADAARGEYYHASTSDNEDDTQQTGTEDNAIWLSIPYFGNIRIAKDGLSKSDGPASASQQEATRSQVHPYNDTPTIPAASTAAYQVSSLDPPLSNIHTGYQFGAELPGADWQAVPMYTFDQDQVQQSISDPAPPFDSMLDTPGQQHLLVPNLNTGVDDWALQGVDMAFFDRLMRGTEVPSLEDPAAWPNNCNTPQ